MMYFHFSTSSNYLLWLKKGVFTRDNNDKIELSSFYQMIIRKINKLDKAYHQSPPYPMIGDYLNIVTVIKTCIMKNINKVNKENKRKHINENR